MRTVLLLTYYAASSGNSLPTFRVKVRYHLQGIKHPESFYLEDVAGRLSQNVGKEFPLLAV